MAVASTEALWSLAKVDLKGNVKSFYQFPAAERPGAAIYASDGNYYGVSQATNASTGYVYRVTPAGVPTKLHGFPAKTFAGYLAMPLLEAGDGNLYGATPYGGANGTGAIYKLTLGGQYTLLYSFPKGNLGGPTALIEGSDGNLYGATLGAVRQEGYSQLFRIGKSGQYAVVDDMKDVRRDGACQCSLAQGSDGIVYGTAAGGGIYGGGLYFALDAGQPNLRRGRSISTRGRVGWAPRCRSGVPTCCRRRCDSTGPPRRRFPTAGPTTYWRRCRQGRPADRLRLPRQGGRLPRARGSVCSSAAGGKAQKDEGKADCQSACRLSTCPNRNRYGRWNW